MSGWPRLVLGLALAAGTLVSEPVMAQAVRHTEVDLIVPPTRRGVFRPSAVVKLDSVAVRVSIDGQVAVTELELTVSNPSGVSREAELLLPVPDGAAVRSLQYDGTGPEPTARLMPREDARRIYNEIVGSMKDPALLEFVGQNVIRTSAFPVPPGGTQKLRLTYEQVLTMDGSRLDWMMPRTESLGGTVPWTLSATIKSAEPVAAVFSPSHELTTQRTGPGQLTATASSGNLLHTGSLRLSVLKDAKALTQPVATVLATPDPERPGSGYFMMLVGLPEGAGSKPLPREVTLVIDRSGSMAGKKFEQTRLAAERVLHGLNDGERFSIVDYSDTVTSFKPGPVALTAESKAEALSYLAAMRATGGTNIRDALTEALRPLASPGTLPLVLFMTDGRPTTGETGEAAIRKAVKGANGLSADAKARRIYSFGVGWDVNTPLLTGLARDARGTTTFVNPDEDIEVKVSQTFDRLSGPVLASPAMKFVGADGESPSVLLRDVLPAELSDTFKGEQIVIMGRYTGVEGTKVQITGELYGQPTTMTFDVLMGGASISNSFVSRAWAMRRVGWLVEQIRTNFGERDVRTDPSAKELVDEIILLSTKHGILTEYTAFLSTEPSVNMSKDEQRSRFARQLQTANTVRAGGGAVQQDAKMQSMNMPAPASAPAGAMSDSNVVYRATGGQLKEERLPVQNLAGRAFFQRNAQWTQGELIAQEAEKADLEVTVGSDEYAKLAEQLNADGLGAVLSLPGDVLVQFRGQRVRLKNTL